MFVGLRVVAKSEDDIGAGAGAAVSSAAAHTPADSKSLYPLVLVLIF